MYFCGRGEKSLNIFFLLILLFGMSDNERKERFLLAVQTLHTELERLTKQHGLNGQVVTIMLTGIIDHDHFGEPVLKAVFSLDVENEDLLMEAFDFLHFSYESEHHNEYRDDKEDYESENWWRDMFDEDFPAN